MMQGTGSKNSRTPVAEDELQATKDRCIAEARAMSKGSKQATISRLSCGVKK